MEQDGLSLMWMLSWGSCESWPSCSPSRSSAKGMATLAEQAIVIDPRDSVAVAVAELAAGVRCTVRVGDDLLVVEIRETIPFGHKFALRKIDKGEDVLKYGEVIGEAAADIESGAWVHTHNLASKRGKERILEALR